MQEPTKPKSFRRRVFLAGGWTLAGHFFRHGIRFGGNLLMTRLLVPEMFGAMAIASMFMAGLAMFSDLGLRINVVQSKRGEDPLFLNTVWVVQIARGGILWLGALAIAGLLAVANQLGLPSQESVYATPGLPWVIATVAFGAVLNGFESTKLFEASRKLALGRFTLLEIVAQVVGLCCMVAWVMFDRSIWALVAGSLANDLTRVVLSHAILPGTPNRWAWDSTAFKEILGFGKWIFGMSVLGFLVVQGDVIILGGLLSARDMSICVIAFQLYDALENMLQRVVTNVTLPSLSQVARERPGQLRATYYKFHAVIAAGVYGLAGLMMMASPALISFLYDRRYEDAGWMLAIIATAFLAAPTRIADQAFLATGSPRLLTGFTLVRLVTMYAAMPIGFHIDGIRGALLGFVLCHLARWPLAIYYMRRYNLLDVRRELMVTPMVFVGMIFGYMVNRLF